MRVSLSEFNPRKFSFHKDPVLVIENFWSPEDRSVFQIAMAQAKWRRLSEIPAAFRAFPNCGDWLKAEIGPSQGAMFLDRVAMPCVADYIESFPNIKGRHMSFSYYSYGVGDCLSTHDDTAEQYVNGERSAGGSLAPTNQAPRRRIAVVSYFHDEWQHDWGGELIVYDSRKKKDGRLVLDVKYCLEPKPGAAVFFTVPRYHRVCRVDPLADAHKRLSIAGWFMTEHEE